VTVPDPIRNHDRIISALSGLKILSDSLTTFSKRRGPVQERLKRPVVPAGILECRSAGGINISSV